MNNKYTTILTPETRINQAKIAPSAVKSRAIDSDIIKNTATETIEFTGLATDTILTITSTIASAVNPDIRIGVLPFMIAFFQDSLDTDNLIPDGSNLSTGDYRIEQVILPQLTLIGHDGKNIVVRTHLTNLTGAPQDIIIVTQSRFLVGGGGGA